MIHPDQHHKLPMDRLKQTGSDYCPDLNQVQFLRLLDYQFGVYKDGAHRSTDSKRLSWGKNQVYQNLRANSTRQYC